MHLLEIAVQVVGYACLLAALRFHHNGGPDSPASLSKRRFHWLRRGPELSKSQQVPRNMVFVLDTSGSMAGVQDGAGQEGAEVLPRAT